MAPAIDVRQVEAIEGGVAVTARVFETGFGTSPYSGRISGVAGPLVETKNISGTAGAGTGADTVTVEFTGFGWGNVDELTVEAVLDSGDREEDTYQVGGGPGPVEPPTGGGDDGGYTVTDCSAQVTPGGNLSVPFTVDGDGGGSFTSVVYVDGQRVHESDWSIVNPPTNYEDVVDADDLPTGEDMSVEIEVDGESFRCGTVTVESDTGGGGGGDPEPPADPGPVDPIEPPTVPELSDVTVDCPSLPSEIQPGGTVTAEYTVSSSVDVPVNVDTALVVNGSEIETATVFVPAESSSSDQFSVRLSEPGDYRISVEATGVN